MTALVEPRVPATNPVAPTGRAPSPRSDAAARRSVMVRSGALAAVSVATALGFARIFAAGSFVPAVLAAALVPHAVGLVGRLRGWSLVRTALLGGAGTALVLVWILAGETTAYGLPTPATLGRVSRLLDVGWQVFRSGVAPVPARPGVTLLSATAIGIAALTADTVARRPEITVGALTPTLVLFVLTGTLGTDDLLIATTLAYIVTALVALALVNSARVERRRTWFTGRDGGGDAATIRSAVAIGGIAVLAAAVITPLLPGIDRPALLTYRSGRGGGSGAGLGDYTGISPLVDLRARLAERSDVELFRVSADRPAYWRLLALDRFDGTTWSLTSEAEDATEVLDRPPSAATLAQRFRITSLADQWMPAAYRPVDTNLGNARVIAESLTLVAPASIAGLEYLVRSAPERPPSPAAIAATDRPVPDSLARRLQLPADLPALVRDTAADVTAGATTPWDRAVALERFFTDGSFTYDLNVTLGDGTPAITEFLTSRRGFCQQFAAAYAAMARAIGLPSRVVVGFTPGRRDEQRDEYVVQGRDAHAWAEVWFAGLGWRTFEPTPEGTEPGMAVPVGAAAAPAAPDPGSTTTTRGAAPSSTVVPGDAADQPDVRRDPGAISTVGGADSDRGWSVRTVSLLALLGAGALGAGIWLIAVLVRPGRLRRQRAGVPDPAGRVDGAWRDALDAVRAASLPVADTLTPQEQVHTLGARGLPPAAVAPLDELARTYARTVFAPDPVTESDATAAWAANDLVVAALDAEVRAATRWSRRYRSGRLTATIPGGD